MIRHPDARVTAYGHLSGFASGISRGARVAQGDIIGFVGATGIATGPHLHYEFRVAGIHRNPLSVALPSALPLPPEQLSVFRARVSDLLPQIAAIRGMQLVMLD
jgi:murein DD-endopeptidase MepM/ murein hydrolase activator NlpD